MMLGLFTGGIASICLLYLGFTMGVVNERKRLVDHFNNAQDKLYTQMLMDLSKDFDFVTKGGVPKNEQNKIVSIEDIYKQKGDK